MKALRNSLLASLAAALLCVPAHAADFLTGAVNGFPTGWSVSDSSEPGTVATKSGEGATQRLAFDLDEKQALSYTPGQASAAGGTADVVISNAVFTTAYEFPGVDEVGGIDSQAAICVYTNTTSGGALQYCGWAGGYTVDEDDDSITNLTWFVLSGATPVEGATNTVTMSFDYTVSPATVTFKIGNTELTPSDVALVNNTKTQVTAVSFSGQGSIGELAGETAPGTVEIAFFNDSTPLWSTNLPLEAAVVYEGPAPTRTATAEYTYDFAGWTNATVTTATAVGSLPVVAGATNYYAAFTATPVSYTLTINYVDGDDTAVTTAYTAQVPYGTEYSVDSPSVTGYTAGTATVTGMMPAQNVTETVTYTANIHTLSITYVVPTGFTAPAAYSQTYAYGAAYSVASPAVTGCTPDVATVADTMGDADVNVTVTYTADTHTLSITYVVPTGFTAPAAYSQTYAYGVSYSVASPAVTGCTPDVATVADTMGDSDVNVTVTYTADTHTLSITYVVPSGFTAPAAYSQAYAYGAAYSVVSPTVTGCTPDVATVADTMGDTDVNVTVTYTANTYTITWVNYDGTTLETDTDVAYNALPSYDGETPTKASDAEYDYTFSGWSDGTTVYGLADALPGVTASITYTAQFSATEIVVPVLALAKPTLSSTVLESGVAGATVKVTVDPAAVVTATNANVAFSSEGAVTNATFTGLPWNDPVDWMLQSSGAEDLPGRFYAKGETEWFNVETNDLDDVTGLADGMKGVDMASAPSAAGQMVRIQTCLEIPEGAMDELPDAQGVGAARTGFAVAQLSGDTAPAFYAFNGTTWDKLVGVAPVANTTNDLLIVLDVQASTARYYVEGVALYKESAGARTYAIPMKASETAAIHGIGFANPDGVLAPVVAEYDVPFEAAVGDTPYARAAAGLAAADKTGVETLYLLTNDVAGTIDLAIGQSVKVDTAKGDFADGAGVVLAQSVPAGYVLGSIASGDVTTYTVDIVEYPIVWMLDLAGATNAVANALTNSYTVADLPITLFPAGCEGYTFDGWTNNFSANETVTQIAAGTVGAITNVATWHQNAFTITWNVEGVETTTDVLPGDMPVYTGTPTKSQDNTYTYEFAGWAATSGGSVIAELPGATEPTIYYAVFTPVYRDYTITWNYKAADGSNASDTSTVHWGETPSHADAAGYVANGTIYTFASWTPTLAAYDGIVAAYTATYTEAAAKASVFTVADNGASTNNVAFYPSLADAIAAAQAGQTVLLLADDTVPATKTAEADRIVVSQPITIDFGAYTLSVPGELEPSSNWAALYIDADTTLKGTTGGIDCLDKENDGGCGVYAINVRNGAALTIEGGVYHGGGTIVQAQLGTVAIKGGTFSATAFSEPYGMDFALNCKDGPYQTGTAGFAVSGGTFVGFDPQNNKAEGENTDFTAAGYVAIADGNGNYVVQPGWNVTFVDEDSTVLETQRVPAGETPVYGGATPTKTADASGVYTFAGWTPEIVAAAADATYTATYSTATPKATVFTVADNGATTNDVAYYASFAEAVAAAQSGQTVVLLADDAADRVTVENAQTLDLGGNTFTGRLTMSDGDVTVTNGTVAGRLDAYDSSVVTLAADATVNGQVVVWGDGTFGEEGCKTPVLNVYGTVSNTGDGAITCNGTDRSGAVINVYDGAVVTSADDVAIFLPSGNLTISGGTVTGTTAVYAKSGSVTVTGGTLSGTGDEADYAYRGDGATATGDALVIDNCGYPNGVPAVSITGGTFVSANAKSVASYVATDSEAYTGSATFERVEDFIPATVEIEGETVANPARFSDADADGVPEGYALKKVEGSSPVVYAIAQTFVVTYANYNGDALQVATNFVNDATPVYAGATPVKPADANIYTFAGWAPPPDATVTSNATYVAQYSSTEAKASVISVADGTTTPYPTLAAAVAAAQAGDTVTLLADETIASPIAVATPVTIDLGGKTLTNNGSGYALEATAAVLVENGTIAGTGRGIKATGSAADVMLGAASKALTVSATGRALGLYDGSSATLAAGSSLATGVKGDVTVFLGAGTAFDVFGSVSQTCETADVDNNAISGNGNAGNGGTTLTIRNGAAVASASAVAVYQPQNGTLNIEGGSVTGPTAVYVKSGSVSVTGGTLTGNGAAVAYNFYGNGGNATGDALVIDNCGYPGGEPTASIEGGTFVSENAKAVASYAKDENFTALAGFIPGTSTALFSDADADGVEEGYYLAPAETEDFFEVKARKSVIGTTIAMSTPVYSGATQDANMALVVKTADETTMLVLDADYVATYGTNALVNAGDYTVTVTGVGAWMDSTNVTFTVARKALTVTAVDKNVVRGNAVTYTVKYEGFVNGETKAVLTAEATAVSDYTPANLDDTTASYVITASGAAAANYDIAYVPGTLTIQDAKVKYTAKNGNVTYKPNVDYTNVSGSGTYQLLADITATTRIVPGAMASDVTLDLNGHTLTSTASDCAVLLSRTGSASSHKTFNLVDTSEEKGGTLKVSAAADAAIQASGKYNDVVIGEGVVIDGGCVAMLSENQTLTVDGTIKGGDDFAVATNGSSTKNTTIAINAGAVLESSVTAVYLPGNEGVSTVVNGGTITGSTGIEIRGGSLEVKGGEITSTAETVSSSPNANGSTVTGAAIAVSQHTTNLPLEVAINGGTLSGPSAVFITDEQDGSPDGVSVAVNDGTILGTVVIDDSASAVGSIIPSDSTALFSDANADGVEAGYSLKPVGGTSDPALYTVAPTFTVLWVVEGETVETDLNIVEGSAPSYDGEEPTKPADAQFTYDFIGWATNGTDVLTLANVAIVSDTTFVAQFAPTGSKATVIRVVDGTPTEIGYYPTLAAAVADAQDGDTVKLLDDVELDARVELNLGAGTTLTLDLGGWSISRTGTGGNGSAFDVKSGAVTIKNGTIDCTQDDAAIVADGVYAITARSGSTVTLADLDVTVDSQAGACVYPFAGSHVTIESGTYANVTDQPYQYHAGWTGMAVNQANGQSGSLITITGGKFSQVNPMLGDDSAAEGTMSFVDPDYFAVPEGGVFTVVPRIDIANAVVTVFDDLVYDATGKEGVASVDYGTTNLVAGTDYVVTYANNVNAGEDTAVATLVGTNLWTGTITTNFSIAKAGATITVTAASKTYGADDPAFAGTVEGLVNEGDLGTVAYSRTGSDENVGTYDDVLTATYTANDNYTVTVVPADFTINAKTLTIVAEAKTQVYGAEAVALTYTSEGLEEGDEITGALTRAEGDDVGTYAISQGTLTAGDNYTIAFTGANYTITKATATVTAEAKSKTYGDDDPELTATVTGLKGEDTAAVISYTLSRAEGEAVGTYAITPAGDAEQGNYDVVYVPANLTIGAKTLTITVAAKTKEYGDADPELTYEADGLEDGDELTGALTRAEGENVGAYAITQGTLAAGENYTIAFTGADLTITKATATVTAEAKSKTYGDADPELTATVTGLKGEDTAAVISYTLSRAEGEAVGTYAITPAGDAEQGNYDVVYVPANLTIGAKTLTITVAAKTKEYGDADPELTYEADGLEDGDELTGALTRAEGENVGAYAITQGTLAAGDNYTIAFTGADLTITKATATVTAEAKSKTYGDADPELTATVTGLKGEDTAAVISYTLSRAEGENAGTYAITPAGDAEQGNYDVVYVPANLTIGAKTLTIVAEAKTQVYGAEAVALTYTSEGLEEGDEITGALTRAEGDDVGTYAISQGTLAAGDNYTIAFTGADYTITAAIVDVPAAPGNKTYNGAVQTADVASADTYTVTNEGGTNVGDYTVVFALKDKANYTWFDGSTTNQTFGWSITKKALKLIAEDKSVAHGAAAPNYTYAVDETDGLVAGDSLATEPALSCSYAAGDATGDYTITISGADAPNYEISYVEGTLTVTANPFTIIWVVDNTQTETNVEWGTMPVFLGSTDKASDGKYAYAFAAWTPAVETVTSNATYTATYTVTIATPLAIGLDTDPTLGSTTVSAAEKTATVKAGLVGAVEGVSVKLADNTDVPVDGATATASFTGLEWNAGVDWTMTATQTAADTARTAESASVPGRFYVKPETPWFTATANDLSDLSDGSDAAVGYTADTASNEGEMVRVHTTVEVPAGGLPQAPETGSAKVGFAVLQLEGDSAPAFYAYGNGTWTKLSGVEPKAGTVDYLAVYDLAAETPTARYYIDGVALYAEGEGGAKTYALPLAADTKSLSSISFASKEMVKSDVVAEQDVSYVAAVETTPYTDIGDALTAAGTAGEKTLALLKADVALDPAVSLGSGEKLVVDYAKGSFTNETPVVSGVAGYDVKVTEAETVKTYELDAIVYPIEYVLDGGENAAANTNEYTVETLPVALADASRTGYTFAGWTNNVAAGVQTSIPVGTIGAVTNVATWTINKYLLTINYLYTNGTEAATAFTSNVVYGTDYSVDSPVLAGYTADKTVVSGNMGAEPVTVDVTYTVNRYSVTFVDEDGSTVLKAATEYDYGTPVADIATPETPAKAATAAKVYTFAGWTPAIETVTSNAVYKASYSEADTKAAVITVAQDGTTNTIYVATIADAIATAGDGDTIQLIGDVEGDATIEHDVTIDLNGNTWTGDVSVSGDVTIVDESDDAGGKLDGAVAVAEDGSVEVAGGTVDDGISGAGDVVVSGGTVNGGIDGTGDVAVSGGTVNGGIVTGGDLEITGGTVVAGLDEPAIVAGGTAAISGGTVTGDVEARNGGDVTISGDAAVSGNVTASGTGGENEPSSVAVTGGSVTGSVVAEDGATATVSGGAVTGSLVATGDDSLVSVTDDGSVGSVSATNGGSAVITGGTVANGITASGEDAVTITGGTVNGTITGEDGSVAITGGHFANDPSDYVADGYVAVAGDPDGYDVIQRKSLEGAVISVADATYDGAAHAITGVSVDDTALVLGTDFTVAYTNATGNVADNVNAGTITVTVTGVGEWMGVATTTFTIAKAPLTVTADDLTVPFRTPADAVPYAISYSGFVNGETNDVFTAQPTATSEYVATAEAGQTFAITVSGAVAANYEITFVNGTLTVGPAEAPTMLETTAITVARSSVTLLHRIQSDAAYHTFFTATSLAGPWTAAEDSRATADIETVVVEDAEGNEYTAGTVTFTGVTGDVRFYQIGYSSVPYNAGDAMGANAVEPGEEP